MSLSIALSLMGHPLLSVAALLYIQELQDALSLLSCAEAGFLAGSFLMEPMRGQKLHLSVETTAYIPCGKHTEFCSKEAW